MLDGVTIEDPSTTYVDALVRVGADTVLRPMTVLRGETLIGRDCEIGPMAQIRDARIGDRVRIGASVVDEAEIGDGVEIGHFNRVRPGSRLESGVSLGTHAEVKNSRVGAGSRINHFACVLDSDVGSDVNVGAGTVTCNYDGVEKNRTTIGDGAFVGTNSSLVAPLRIGAGAYVAAASVVTRDVPAGALAVGRARQRNIEGWQRRPRPERAPE
jgi:bifunctional UDP-N-acetylglucosamine pyrophosphorylase/glucosamine-1-phosphate N-acetyltransferase